MIFLTQGAATVKKGVYLGITSINYFMIIKFNNKEWFFWNKGKVHPKRGIIHYTRLRSKINSLILDRVIFGLILYDRS